MLSTLWSALPIPLGFFCFYLALRQDKNKAEQDLEKSPKNSEKEFVDKYNLDDIDFDKKLYGDNFDNHLDESDEVYYRILFIGLGIGSIILGLRFIDESFETLAKIVFLATVGATIAFRYWHKNKKPKSEDTPQD